MSTYIKTTKDLLAEAVQRGASDLHLSSEAPPIFRIDGDLYPTFYPRLTSQDVRELVYSVLLERQIKVFEETHELDCAISYPKLGRFRVNVYQQMGSIGAVFRSIPEQIMSMDDIGLHPVLKDIVLKPRGLILVTGPTGSGKSTTLAAMIDYINHNKRCHIMTIEDPVEYVFQRDKALINQREVGRDTPSFASALKHVLRQDPDVIMIGEIRDLETIATALTAAETGHLVLTTLHTNNSTQAIDRIIDVFPPFQQEQIKIQLGGVLEAVVSQTLCRKKGGGRQLAYELMLGTDAVKALVREGKTHLLPSVIETSQKLGMQTMDMHLMKLVRRGVITFDEAYSHCHHPDSFKLHSSEVPVSKG